MCLLPSTNPIWVLNIFKPRVDLSWTFCAAVKIQKDGADTMANPWWWHTANCSQFTNPCWVAPFKSHLECHLELPTWRYLLCHTHTRFLTDAHVFQNAVCKSIRWKWHNCHWNTTDSNTDQCTKKKVFFTHFKNTHSHMRTLTIVVHHTAWLVQLSITRTSTFCQFIT